jgi:hypothetical protein
MLGNKQLNTITQFYARLLRSANVCKSDARLIVKVIKETNLWWLLAMRPTATLCVK